VAVGKPHALLLLDARMPDTDGFTLATKIRERVELANPPIVLLTSGDRPGDAARYRDLRVDAHLLKPIQQDELLETIYSIISRSPGGSCGGGNGKPPRADPARESTGASHHAAGPLRILVAEDSDFNAQLMERLLAKRGHSVRVVGDGRTALSLANANDFDLLLLDVHMPELDGFQVIDSIRQHERSNGSHLPVIALTARSRKEDRERCLAAGMDGFLAKPIQTHDLWSTIDQVIARFPPAAPARDKLLDPHVLLSACGGDDAILQSICDALRASLPSQLASIQTAFADNDVSAVREAAHKLAGMVAAFSTVAGKMASDLEDDAASGHLEDARPLMERLQSVSEDLMQLVGNGLSVASLRAAESLTAR
jgi:CheY-like chemotaxis protein